MKFFITGGAGFIGSALIRFLINETDHEVLNLDKLTYAGNIRNLSNITKNSKYNFITGDICESKLVSKIILDFKPDIIMHLAAESHVDRSIEGPSEFIQTNIMGTYVMLECSRKYWETLSPNNIFRFHHISTDEVYGSLGAEGSFNEKSSYHPNSPYSASKASSDHLVRAWNRTFGLPILITNTSNNYGPYQLPEKLIPLMILSALDGKALPIYGNGQQVRDWLYVEDHVNALYQVVINGQVGETYNIGGNNEKTNINVVQSICDILDELKPSNQNNLTSYRDLIKFVKDRPGHDQRYSIDSAKINSKLGWKPRVNFETGLRKTVKWYIDNIGLYKKIYKNQYNMERIGMIKKNKHKGSK